MDEQQDHALTTSTAPPWSMFANRPWLRSWAIWKANADSMTWRGAAEAVGFASVMVIDDDLGRSGSGIVERPGFERLVAMVCSGDVGAVFCIEASRLARNGRDWHHLIDLCALAGRLGHRSGRRL